MLGLVRGLVLFDLLYGHNVRVGRWYTQDGFLFIASFGPVSTIFITYFGSYNMLMLMQVVAKG